MLSRAISILGGLVRIPSVSANSNRPVSNVIRQILQNQGFLIEEQAYRDGKGIEKVSLIATRGTGSGGVLYCAHSDVVPVDSWSYSEAGPFEFHQTADRIYSRGSCDMKGSLACFLAAAEKFAEHNLQAPLSVIVTADEELGFVGAEHVSKNSALFRQLVDQQPLTIIGEPTLLNVVHAHKGIYVFQATSKGRAGHSSTLEAINANVKMIPFLNTMYEIYQETLTDPTWSHDAFDPPLISWNIGINDFTYASNIAPERSVCTVSFRPMPDQPIEKLMDRVRAAAEMNGLILEIDHAAPPFFVPADAPHIQQMLSYTGQEKAKTVSYASDAAMFGELKRMIICGPGDIVQAHTDVEWIAIDQLEKGTNLYSKLIKELCCS